MSGLLTEHTSSNSFGGPLGRPFPITSQNPARENNAANLNKQELQSTKAQPENSPTNSQDFEQLKATAYSSIDTARQLLDKNPKLKVDFDQEIRGLQKQWDEASEAASDPELKQLAQKEFEEIVIAAETNKSQIRKKLPKPVEEKDYIVKNEPAPDKETILADESKFTRTSKTYQNRHIYKDEESNFYYVDNFHGGKTSEIEVFNKRGQHLGTINLDGAPKHGPIPGRKIDIK